MSAALCRCRGATRAAVLGLLLLVAVAPGCARSPNIASDSRRSCPSLDSTECAEARALVAAASTYADEAHDYLLVSNEVTSGSALARGADGWRPLLGACGRTHASPRIDSGVVEYAFVGVAVDSTLVSADADVGPLLARESPTVHDVSLVAMAFVRDLAPAPFDRTASVVETASGSCSCGEATHFAGDTKYGAMVAYAFRAPRKAGWLSRDEKHVRAIDVVRRALGDPAQAVHRTRTGVLSIDGLARFASGGRAAPLTFQVADARPIAFAAAPIAELCDFPTPEVSPSPIDFGVAPYGIEARRSVHVVNRAPIELRALLGADTFVVPAAAAVDLPVRWTPDGDAPGCETQTRDLAIPFLRLGGQTARSARVLETIRTGRATVSRTERVVPTPPKLDLDSTVRDWTCPRDFVRAACRAENTGTYEVVAEPRGEDSCHFACRGPSAQGRRPDCRFDAVMDCALRCAP